MTTRAVIVTVLAVLAATWMIAAAGDNAMQTCRVNNSQSTCIYALR